MVQDWKSLQEYPVNTGAPRGSILVPTFSLLFTNDLLGNVIYNIAIYTDDIIFYSIYWSGI